MGRRAGKYSVLEIITFVWIALSLIGLIWTPYDPQAQSFRDISPTTFTKLHWLGVDGYGRDMLSRVWRGSGNTIILGLVASLGTLFSLPFYYFWNRRVLFS